MAWAHDLGVWALALVTQWMSYVWGGAATGLVLLIERAKGSEIIKGSAFIAFLVVMFLVASFSTWEHEYRTDLSDKARLQNEASPDLHATIDSVAPFAWRNGNDQGFVIAANVTNHGAPSFADQWRIFARTTDGKEVEATSVYPPTIRVGPVSYTPAEFLANRSLRAIRQGELVRGILVAWFRGRPFGTVDPHTVRLEFLDIDRSPKWTNNSDFPIITPSNATYLPGL